MNVSIQIKFILGICFFFLIILVLSIFAESGLSRLVLKNNAILKENHYSVVYAREMSEAVNKINHEIIVSFLMKRKPDNIVIEKEVSGFKNSFESEKKNITEPGEEGLVLKIENKSNLFFSSLDKISSKLPDAGLILTHQLLHNQLLNDLSELSGLNEQAIEKKTTIARMTAHNALTQMTLLATFCFLVTLGFTYSFISYFSERFFQLYKGIKELAANNYGYRLYFEGKDEFSEISLVFNSMAEKLTEEKNNKIAVLNKPNEDNFTEKMKELTDLISRIKIAEIQANHLIANLKKNPHDEFSR